MPITLNRFSPGILTAAQLNALVDAIVAKFNGQITTGDVSWPLRAGGNIDMAQFEILHLYKLWNTYNLAERATTVSLQDVFDAVNTAGGGVVLLPSDTTETIGTGGVTIGANTIVMGGGESSVFATTGTLTNHMLRNKVNGDSGIMFVNCKIDSSGSSGGAFDVVAMTRTSRIRFVDCRVLSIQQHGVSLRSDSAGTSCVGTWFDRCQFDVSGNGDSGIFLQDVQRVYVSDCEFNITASTAAGIQATALGGTSNMADVHIDDNTFTHATGTTQSSIVVAGPGTTGIKKFHITGNEMTGGGTNSFYVDVDAGNVAVRSHLKIMGNSISGGSTTSAGIRVRNALHFNVSDNTVELTGTALGILIGATARAGSAAACRDYICSENTVNSSGESSFVFCHPGSAAILANVHGNNGATANATVGEFEIWNLLAHPTTMVFDSSFQVNMVDDGSASLASWVCYTGVGATRGGRAGNAANSNLIFNNNNVSGTVFGTVGAADDFFTPSEPSTAKYSREGNVGT